MNPQRVTHTVTSPVQCLVSCPLPCGYKHAVTHPSWILNHVQKEHFALLKWRSQSRQPNMAAKSFSWTPTGFQHNFEATVKTEEVSGNLGFQLLLKSLTLLALRCTQKMSAKPEQFHPSGSFPPSTPALKMTLALRVMLVGIHLMLIVIFLIMGKYPPFLSLC